MARPTGTKLIAENRRARYDYELLERFEAGIALVGTEVKSLRDGRVTLAHAYADVRDNEVWLVGAEISEYAQGNIANHEPTRDRKLLLKRAEISDLVGKVREKGRPSSRRASTSRTAGSRSRSPSHAVRRRATSGARSSTGTPSVRSTGRSSRSDSPSHDHDSGLEHVAVLRVQVPDRCVAYFVRGLDGQGLADGVLACLKMTPRWTGRTTSRPRCVIPSSRSSISPRRSRRSPGRSSVCRAPGHARQRPHASARRRAARRAHHRLRPAARRRRPPDPRLARRGLAVQRGRALPASLGHVAGAAGPQLLRRRAHGHRRRRALRVHHDQAGPVPVGQPPQRVAARARPLLPPRPVVRAAAGDPDVLPGRSAVPL